MAKGGDMEVGSAGGSGQPSSVDDINNSRCQQKQQELMSHSTTSVSAVCRFCHTGTGRMISPCGCDGSLRHVHEHCLNEWIHADGNSRSCEICRDKYAIDKEAYKRFSEWQRPIIDAEDIFRMGLIACVAYSLFYTSLLIAERMPLERFFNGGMSPGIDDWLRCAIDWLLFGMLIVLLWDIIKLSKGYLKRQKTQRFRNFKQRPTKH